MTTTLGISAHEALNIVWDELLPKPRTVQRDVLNNAQYGNARQALAAIEHLPQDANTILGIHSLESKPPRAR